MKVTQVYFKSFQYVLWKQTPGDVLILTKYLILQRSAKTDIINKGFKHS